MIGRASVFRAAWKRFLKGLRTRIRTMLLCFVLVPALAWAPDTVRAEGADTLRVTPLMDEAVPSGHKSPERPRDVALDSRGAVAADGPSGPAGRGESAREDRPGGRENGTVLAYLVELSRRQKTPCPSGKQASDVPHLVFSEPLCGVAEDLAQGKETIVGSITGRGIPALRARALGVQGASAREAFAALRAAHCDALVEPYTHVGAVRASSGWWVVLAELSPEPLAEGSVVRDDGAPPDSPVSTVIPGPDTANGPGAALPDREREARPEPGEGTPPMTQEGRAMLERLNTLRERGGRCIGSAMPPAPKLRSHALLQETAMERATSGSNPGAHPGSKAGVDAYRGTIVRELAATMNGTAGDVLDVWLGSPVRCDHIFDPSLRHAGVGYADGHWVVLLANGEKPDGARPPSVRKDGVKRTLPAKR